MRILTYHGRLHRCLGSLTRLVFGGNDIGDRGCKAVASALRWGEGSGLGARLQTLDLNDNGGGILIKRGQGLGFGVIKIPHLTLNPREVS